MKILIELFVSFAKIGVCTFGGGYAMLPLIKREVVEKKQWAEEEEIFDYYAIGQCTPGVIAVNTATFIGYKKGGILGGFFATAGIVFPSFVIITLIAAFLRNFADIEAVKYGFNGIRAVVCALVLNAVISMIKKGVKDMLTFFLLVVVFALVAFFNLNPVYAVVISGIIGVLAGKIGIRKGKSEGK